MWTGDYRHLLCQLISKDFKTRYRRMSLGVFWSLLNPLVMMGVYALVFTQVLRNPTPHFPVHILSGLIAYNFFSLAWVNATTSIMDNAGLIKRNPVTREIIPIASILSNIPHVLIQLCLLVVFVYVDGLKINVNWLWLPVLWGLEVVCLIGLGLACSALYVVVRDIRYVVESVNVVLFWLVPIVYSFEMVPDSMRPIYELNPLAALVFATHCIILNATHPPLVLMMKLTLFAGAAFIVGLQIFKQVQRKFYEYL